VKIHLRAILPNLSGLRCDLAQIRCENFAIRVPAAGLPILFMPWALSATGRWEAQDPHGPGLCTLPGRWLMRRSGADLMRRKWQVDLTQTQGKICGEVLLARGCRL